MGTPLVQAKENSIEIYDDNLGRHTVLTRSARMRKFRFYQYKPIHESPTHIKESNNDTNNTSKIDSNQDLAICSKQKSIGSASNDSMLLTRDNVLQGKVALVPEQSQELIELDNRIAELEKRIADLNDGKKDEDNLDEIFSLVNKKNDLLRRQMQLNIIEQEKVLEKANEELTKELRSLMSIDDTKKSKVQLERQQYLYNQSLALVNRRNELVHHMDDQERGIEDDNKVKATLKHVISDKTARNRMGSGSQDQNCVIQ